MYVILDEDGSGYAFGDTVQEAAEMWEEVYDAKPDMNYLIVVSGKKIEVAVVYSEKAKPSNKKLK